MATLSAFVGAIEFFHHQEFGHYFSYGLHADALNRDADIGIPGQTKMYWSRLSNYTFWPTKLDACDFITDEMLPGTEYPYAVQRLNTSSNTWDTIVEANGEGYCRPTPLSTVKATLAFKRLWPGLSVDVMEGEATGAREPFQQGDLARFVIFTTADKNTAWNSAIPTPSFVIQDQVIKGNNSYRVKH